MSGLRAQALRGGAFLVGRETAGIAIRLVGVLVLTRLIGPANFGIYSGAAAVVTVLTVLAQLGAEVFLIRREAEPSRDEYDAVFSVLVISSLDLMGAALLGSLVVDSFVRDRAATDAFRVLVLTLPINVLWAPAQAKLERALRFDSMAVLEVGGDVALYGVSVCLAVAGLGLWAPVLGYVAWQSWLLIASYRLARYRPGWRWDPVRAGELLRYGRRFLPGGFLQRAELLVSPVVVGGFLGATAVGYVTLVVRIVDTLGFAMRVTWRLSIVSFGRVQSDLVRLRRGFEETMVLQTLAFAPLAAAFAVGAPRLIPLLFGSEWKPAVALYPWLGTAALLGCILTTDMAVLYVAQRSAALVRIGLWRFGLLAVAAAALVPWLGLIGFGIATLVPHATLLLADREVRSLFPFQYGRVLIWTGAFAPVLFVPVLPLALALGAIALPFAVACTPGARRQLALYFSMVTKAVREKVARA